jgi:hypothetical protein
MKQYQETDLNKAKRVTALEGMPHGIQKPFLVERCLRRAIVQ